MFSFDMKCSGLCGALPCEVSGGQEERSSGGWTLDWSHHTLHSPPSSPPVSLPVTPHRRAMFLYGVFYSPSSQTGISVLYCHFWRRRRKDTNQVQPSVTLTCSTKVTHMLFYLLGDFIFKSYFINEPRIHLTVQILKPRILLTLNDNCHFYYTNSNHQFRPSWSIKGICWDHCY